MEEETNQLWLDTLKVGDPVIVDGRDAFDRAKVVRRTPTGRIVIQWGKGTREFNADGSLRTSDTWAYGQLLEPTQERRDVIAQANLACKIGQTAWRKVPLATLRAIDALLRGEG